MQGDRLHAVNNDPSNETNAHGRIASAVDTKWLTLFKYSSYLLNYKKA
jgi:hypothetical protein